MLLLGDDLYASNDRVGSRYETCARTLWHVRARPSHARNLVIEVLYNTLFWQQGDNGTHVHGWRSGGEKQKKCNVLIQHRRNEQSARAFGADVYKYPSICLPSR